MVQHPERTTAARRGGRDIGKGGGEAAHRGGYRGKEREKAGAGMEGRQARRGEKVRRGVLVWVQLLARVYIAAIYSIFIYILSIYL